MTFKPGIVISLWLACVTVVVCGCISRPLPSSWGGLPLEPGRYLKEYYRAPDFAADEVTYVLEPFVAEEVQGIGADDFRALFQTELTQTWQANGLKLKAGAGACRLSGTVQRVGVHGSRFRWLLGKISASLIVAGAITREDQTLFAFRDQIWITSPVNPGPPAPKEDELLVRQAVRAFAQHLLTELLLVRTE
jgi:hypothetical protein